jgi:hypothetical protein
MGLDLLTPLGFGYHPIASTEPLVWVLRLARLLVFDKRATGICALPGMKQCS